MLLRIFASPDLRLSIDPRSGHGSRGTFLCQDRIPLRDASRTWKTPESTTHGDMAGTWQEDKKVQYVLPGVQKVTIRYVLSERRSGQCSDETQLSLCMAPLAP
jgi:hypothetical protein